MPDVAYAKQKGKEGQAPRRIYKGNRRRKVAELVAKGMSERAIAKELGIGKTTVARDKKWLKTSEHLLRAQEAAQEQELIVVEEMPTNPAEFRELEKTKVVELVGQRKTYEQVAKQLGISVRTVINHINAYLSEYGDFGGRTMMDWRNEHLLASYEMMAELQEDMACQPVRGYDANGDESGWDMTPFQAQRVRDAARKRYMELMQYQAKLLQLLVQKTEIDVEQKVMVMSLRGVDLDAFPKQEEPTVLTQPQIEWTT